MMKILKIELYKLRHRPAFWITCAALLALTIAFRFFIPPESSTELLTGLTMFTMIFAISEAVGIARRDYLEQTTKNYLTAGYSRTQVFFGKMFAAIHASLIYFLIEAIVSVAMIFLNSFAIKLSVSQIAITVGLQLVENILIAIFSFSLGYMFIKSVWSIILSFSWVTFGPLVATLLCNQYKVPIDLGQYILGAVSNDPKLFNTDTMIQEGVIIACTLIFMVISCIVSNQREIKE